MKRGNEEEKFVLNYDKKLMWLGLMSLDDKSHVLSLNMQHDAQCQRSLCNRRTRIVCLTENRKPMLQSSTVQQFLHACIIFSPVSFVCDSNVNIQHVRFPRWDNYESEAEDKVARKVSELKCEEGHYRLMCINFCSEQILLLADASCF